MPKQQNETKKEVPLTLEQRVANLEGDIREVARGVNLQGALLEAMIVANDRIVQKYLALIRTEEKVAPEAPKA